MDNHRYGEKVLTSKAFPIALALMLALGGLLPSEAMFGRDDNRTDIPSPHDGSRSSFIDDADSLMLTNGLIQLTFNKTAKGGLESVFDPVSGVEFRTDKDMPATLFFLGLKNTTQYLALASYSPCTFSYVGANGINSSELTLTYEMLGGLPINITAHVEVKDNDPRSYWDIMVDNDNDTRSLVEVQYPVIWGLPEDLGGNAKDDFLAVSKYDGIVYRDPYPKTQAPYTNFKFHYPGTIGMQFMAIYDPDASGILLETLDTEGHVKSFNMANGGPDDNVMASITHYNPEVPGNDFSKGYASTISIFQGDWYDAADVYKTWALQQPWTSKGELHERTDVPDWWLDPSPVILIENRDLKGDVQVPLEEWSDVVEHYKDLIGTNVTLFVRGWEQNGSFTGPYYLPPKDGPENVKTEVKEVIVSGGHVYFSTSERFWRLKMPYTGYDSTADFEAMGRPWAVLDTFGEPLKDPGYEALGMDSVVMDTSTQWWQDTVVDYSVGVADMAVDVYKLDEFPTGAWVPCYNTSHGHPAGWGKYITDGHLEILDRVATEGRAVNPDLVIATEQATELILDRIQTYVSRDNSPEIALYMGDLNEFGDDVSAEPMFSYVYHQYTTTYGEFNKLGGTNIDANYNSSARAIARALVRGKLISGHSEWDYPDDPGLSELLTRTANATATYAKDYVYFGEMLKPPTVHSPLIDIPYYDWMHTGTGWTSVKDEQVLNSAWLSPDGGRIAHTIVNWGNTSVDITVPLPSYHLSNDNYTIYITRNGDSRTLVNSTSLPLDIDLTMGPRDVVLLEVLSAPDAVVKEITPSLIDPIQGDEVTLDVDIANGGSYPLYDIKLFLYENGIFFDNRTVSMMGPDTNETLTVTWNTTGKDPGQYNITARIWPQMGEISLDNNEATITLEVLPRPVGSIRCTVIDNSTTAPLVGALVTLFDPVDRTVLDFALSRPDTDVLFEDLSPGTYGLNATKADHITDENLTVVVVSDNSTQVTLALGLVPVAPTTGDIVGHIYINTTTTYLAGARAFLVETNQSYYVSWDGMFTFLDLEPGNYTLMVDRTGYYDQVVNLTVIAGETLYVNISLVPVPEVPQLGDLVGVVLDNGTGEPIEDALVLLLGEGQMQDTNSSGGILFSDLAFGNYTLNITASGYIPMNVTAEVLLEGPNLVTVRLDPVWVPPPPFITIIGYVKDEKDAPVLGAKINIIVGTNLSTTLTDAEGFYQVEELDPGQIRIELTAKGFEDQSHVMGLTNGGTYWKNMTLKNKVTEPTEEGENMTVTYVLVGLNLLMLLGLLLLLSTGRKQHGTKVKRRKKKMKKVLDDDEDLTVGDEDEPRSVPDDEE